MIKDGDQFHEGFVIQELNYYMELHSCYIICLDSSTLFFKPVRFSKLSHQIKLILPFIPKSKNSFSPTSCKLSAASVNFTLQFTDNISNKRIKNKKLT